MGGLIFFIPGDIAKVTYFSPLEEVQFQRNDFFMTKFKEGFQSIAVVLVGQDCL